MTALDLDAIEQRANEATPGPWTAHAEDIFYPRDDEDRGPVSSLLGGGEPGHLADAEFMAHARQDVPALVAEVRRLGALAVPFQVGDPDPTPKFDPDGPMSCGERNPDGVLHILGKGAAAFCTWSVGHPDRWSHVAGSSNGLIVAVW
jgi:hypothetical protein